MLDSGGSATLSARRLGERLHHETRAATRDVRHHGGAPVQLRDTAEVDGEGEHHVLALAQSEVRRLDEYTGRAQVHGLAELASATGHRDVDDGARAMPGVQSAFHCVSPCSWFFCSSVVLAHYALCSTPFRGELNVIRGLNSVAAQKRADLAAKGLEIDQERIVTLDA